MEKVCTLIMPRGTITNMKKLLKRHGIDKENVDITREFTVNGIRVKVATFIAEEEVFSRIMEEDEIHRIY